MDVKTLRHTWALLVTRNHKEPLDENELCCITFLCYDQPNIPTTPEELEAAAKSLMDMGFIKKGSDEKLYMTSTCLEFLHDGLWVHASLGEIRRRKQEH